MCDVPLIGRREATPESNQISFLASDKQCYVEADACHAAQVAFSTGGYPWPPCDPYIGEARST